MKVEELKEIKLWFGYNPKKVNTFRKLFFEKFGVEIVKNEPDTRIQALFCDEKGVAKKYAWTYMPDNYGYFENHEYREVNPDIFLSWKARLGGL